MLILSAMLQGRPATSQAIDSTPPTDSSRTVGTRVVLRRPLLLELPVDDPREALTLVPGIVRRGTALGIGAGAGLYLRAGGANAAAVYIDGVPVRNLTSGATAITLPIGALETITVTRGLTGADVADGHGGGVIDYTTRSGGRRLEGSFHAASDAPFGSGSNVGYNRFDATGGGPLGARASWFVAGEVTGQRSAYRGAGAGEQPAYAWGGVDTVVDSVAVPKFLQSTGLRRPLDWITQRRALGKLTVQLGAGSQLAATVVASDVQQRFFPGSDIGDTALFSGARALSRLAIVHWSQRFGDGGKSPALNFVVSFAHDGSSSGLLTAASQAATADPTLGIEWSALSFLGSDSISRVTDQLIRNIRSNAGLRVPLLNRTDLRIVQPYRLNPYGLAAGWPTGGSDGDLSLGSENRFDARTWIEWPSSSHHHVRLGAELGRASQTSYAGRLITELDLDAWIAHPRHIGLFAEDHITVGRATLDLGARFDDFDPGGAVPLVPGRIFSNPAWGQGSAVDDTAYAGSLARVYQAVPRKSALSPRLRADYLVAGGTMIRFGVGRQVEPSSASQLFGGSNADLANNLASAPFGGNVNYVSTTTVDLGFRHAFGVLALDVDGYLTHRAVYLDLIKPFDDPANPGRTINLAVPTAIDSIGARGLEAMIDWVPRANVDGRLTYTFERSQGVTTQALGALGRVTTPGTLGSALRGVSAVVMVQAESGVPYTSSGGTGTGAVVRDDIDPVVFLFGSRPNGRLPWTTTVDLRIRKEVHVSRWTASAYADVRNALNVRNLIGAFLQTHAPTNALYQAEVLSPEFSTLRVEASQNGVLLSGNAVDLRPDCGSWTGTTGGPIDCAALRQVERRFGNGDGVYDVTEQTTAFDAYYEAFFGSAQFYAPARSARIGLEIEF